MPVDTQPSTPTSRCLHAAGCCSHMRGRQWRWHQQRRLLLPPWLEDQHSCCRRHHQHREHEYSHQDQHLLREGECMLSPYPQRLLATINSLQTCFDAVTFLGVRAQGCISKHRSQAYESLSAAAVHCEQACCSRAPYNSCCCCCCCWPVTGAHVW